MQLLYIWIKDFRNIKNLGFNFSSEYDVKYKQKLNTLTIVKRAGFVENFFGDKITEINAIIGKNGTGKSNVLDYICSVIVPGKRSGKGSSLFVFKDENVIRCFDRLRLEDDLQVDIPDGLSCDLEFDTIDSWDCVFYSNVSDGREYSFEGNKVINLSYTENCKNESNKIKYLCDILKDTNKDNYLSSVYKGLNEDEINFVFSIESDLLDKNLYDKEHLKRFSLIKDRYKAAFNTTTSNSNLFKYGLTFAIFKYFFCNKYSSFIKSKSLLNVFNNVIIDEDGANSVKFIKETNPEIIKALSTIEDYDSFSDKENDLNPDFFRMYLELIDKFNDSSIMSEEELLPKNKDRFQFVFSKDLREIIQEYYEIFDRTKIIKHDWAKLSSGFKAYLNLFSNIYSHASEAKKGNLLICIDEGDLYFHPEMQRCFLNDIIVFFNSLFKDKEVNIQIILTSHSPFLVSDLPKENLILLKNEKKSNGVQKLIVEDNKSLTFASNIYKLFNNQFFLDKGTVGEFAKSKLEYMLKILNKDIIDQKDVEIYENINSKIGDEVICMRMEELLYEKSGNIEDSGRNYLREWYKSKSEKL